jgi:hypothetical protein
LTGGERGPVRQIARAVFGNAADAPLRSHLRLNGIEDSDGLLMAMVLHIVADDDDAV